MQQHLAKCCALFFSMIWYLTFPTLCCSSETLPQDAVSDICTAGITTWIFFGTQHSITPFRACPSWPITCSTTGATSNGEPANARWREQRRCSTPRNRIEIWHFSVCPDLCLSHYYSQTLVLKVNAERLCPSFGGIVELNFQRIS